MPPKESDALLDYQPTYGSKDFSLNKYSFPDDNADVVVPQNDASSNAASRHASASVPSQYNRCGIRIFAMVLFLTTLGVLVWSAIVHGNSGYPVGSTFTNRIRSKIHGMAEDIAEATSTSTTQKVNTNGSGTGPYSLVEAHKGKSFFDFYTFLDGPDSIGSAGYNTYVGREKAEALGLIKIEADEYSDDNDNNKDEYVYLSSSAPAHADEHGHRPRDSIRLEGTRRFDHGLILLDVSAMPTGCGVWPAFWTTDEKDWPKHGEIDIVEPINNQRIAKTALHTSEDCDMYAHVPRWNWTGHWDSSTGLPDTFTGIPNFESSLEADNCWTMTPHQWANQGCVAISDTNGTIGAPMNANGGGVYALEWDPTSGYIKSWVFPRSEGIPENLREVLALESSSSSTGTSTSSVRVRPDPASWPTPYAYFAIGAGTGCSADHFSNHRLVINLAFCGAVAGNRFRTDCPDLYEEFNVRNDSVATCNAYIDSQAAQGALEKEAFWKIKGVYLYQRDSNDQDA